MTAVGHRAASPLRTAARMRGARRRGAAAPSAPRVESTTTVAFVQVAVDDLGHRAVGEPRVDRTPAAACSSRSTQTVLAPRGASGVAARARRACSPWCRARLLAARRPATRCRPAARGGRKRSAAFGTREHVLALGVDDGDVGGHPRAQAQVRVVDVDDRVVGDDVLHRRRRVADLPDLAVEALARETRRP